MGVTTKVSKLVFDGDDRKYQQTLANMDKKTQSTFARLKRFGKQHALAIGASIAGIVYSTAKLIKTYGAQEQAENRLRAALRARGRDTEAELKRVKEWSAELQRNTTVTDEQATAVAAMGINMANLSGDQLPKAIAAIADYRAGLAKTDGVMRDMTSTGRRVFQWLNDLDTSVTEIEKHVAGWTEADTELVKQLIESGKKIEAQDYVIRKLGESYKGAAAAQREGTGILKSLNNAFGDAKEKIGEVIFKGLEPLFKKVTENLEGFKLSEETIDKWAGRVETAANIVAGLVKVIWELTAPIRWTIKLFDQAASKLSEWHGKNMATPEEIRSRLGLGGPGSSPETATTVPTTTVTADKPAEDTDPLRVLKLPRSQEEIEHELQLLRMRNSGVAAEISTWYDTLHKLAKKRKEAEKVLNQKADSDEAKRQKEAAKKELELIKMKEEQATKLMEEESAKRQKLSFDEAKTAISNLGVIVGGREKAAKLVAVMDTAQAVRSLYKSLFTDPPRIFSKIASQTGIWGLAKAAAVSAAAAVAIKQGISRVKGYNKGGYVPGNAAMGDVIPARLTGEEFVVNAPATAENRDLLERINAGLSPGGDGTFRVEIGLKGDADKFIEVLDVQRVESGY